MGSRAISPMRAKEIASSTRETKHQRRDRRDDGHLRRHEKDALTVAELREQSRARDVYVGAYTRYKHELFVRKRMTDAQRNAREAFIPVAAVSPKGAMYGGRVQEGDTYSNE